MSISIAISGFGWVMAVILLLSRLARRRAGPVLAAGGEHEVPPSRRQVGPYAIERKLGAGATAEVYSARRASDGRPLALKLLPWGASRRARERFEREARFGAELHHPNAAAVYGRGEGADGTGYIAMELVDGETLQQLVEREGPLPAARAARFARQLCAALAHLHERGLVHRDIKPENVVVTGGARGRVKLIDFGLVEPVGAVLEPELIAGTPLYMSPEALTKPGSVDARSDLYALGALMFFMLCGAPVFHGRSLLEVCIHHLHTAPERPSTVLGKAISPVLERVVLDCLAKEASARPASATEVAQRLSVCLARSASGPEPRDRARPEVPPSVTMRARRASMRCLGSSATVPCSADRGRCGVTPSHVMRAPGAARLGFSRGATRQAAACCSVQG